MKTIVLIPIYRRPTPDEARAMRHNREVLNKWPHTIVAPEDLDLEGIEQICPATEIIRVSDEWLGSRNGIAGYNKMMLSEKFYRMFEEFDYILICHNDAWIFRDELSKWTAKVTTVWLLRGYDVRFTTCRLLSNIWHSELGPNTARANLAAPICMAVLVMED